MPRKDLSLAERIALLDRFKTDGPETTRRELSLHTWVPKTTMSEGFTEHRRRRIRETLVKRTRQTTLHKFFNAMTHSLHARNHRFGYNTRLQTSSVLIIRG